MIGENRFTHVIGFLRLALACVSAVILLAGIAACGGGSGNSEPPPPPPPESACNSSFAGAVCKTLNIGGSDERQYLFYEPTNRQDTAPVLVLLHGDPGRPASVEAFFGGKEFADDNGYILAVPEGRGSFAWTSAVNQSGNISQDSIFIESLIDELVINEQADQDKVYVAGFSAGGFMVYKLACEIPELINAAVAVSGQFRGDFAQCNAPSPLAIHHVHGTRDEDVPAGGRADNIASVEETLGHWQSVNNCEDEFITSAEFEITIDQKTATTRSYASCNAPLEYTQVERGQHEEEYQMQVLHDLMRRFFEPASN